MTIRDRHPRFFDALIWPAAILGDSIFLLSFVASGFLVVQVLGGSHGDLALVGAAFSATYLVSAWSGARLGTRVGFKQVAVAGTGLLIVAALLISLTTTLWGLALGMSILGIGGGIMWPNIEAELSRGRQGPALRRRMSLFNAMWCTGTLIGPLLLAWLYPTEATVAGAGGRAAINVAFYVTSGLALLMGVLLALWRTRIPPPEEVQAEIDAEAPRDPIKLRAFLLMSYVANLFCYVVLGVLRQLYEALADHQWHGHGAAQFDPNFAQLQADLANHAWLQNVAGGIQRVYEFLAGHLWQRYGAAQIDSGLLVLLAAASTTMFAVLYFAHRWPYRLKRYVFWQLTMMAGLVLVASTGNVPLVALGFVAVGVASSFFYSGSLFYSIEGRDESKHMAGWHEVIVGAGNLGGLLLAGNVPALLRGLGLSNEEWLIRSPYFLVIALMAVALAVQLGIYAWHRPRFTRTENAGLPA